MTIKTIFASGILVASAFNPLHSAEINFTGGAWLSAATGKLAP
jgi:hypothetical protein